MVEQADLNAIIDRVNELTRRLRMLEEQFSAFQDRLDDLMRNFMKKNSEFETSLNESKSSFKSVVSDLISIKKELKAIKREMVKLAPAEKVEELEGFINLLSPMESVTRDEVRKIVQEMMRGGTA